MGFSVHPYYRLEGEMECNDVDECQEDREICGGDVAGFCFNSVGSYACVCNEGFANKNATCVNINECAVNNDLCSGLGQEQFLKYPGSVQDKTQSILNPGANPLLSLGAKFASCHAVSFFLY